MNCVVLTIVFSVESGKRRLSMTSLYERFSVVRIALLNPEDGRSSSWIRLDEHAYYIDTKFNHNDGFSMDLMVHLQSDGFDS